MTDAEITRALAENVMGWEVSDHIMMSTYPEGHNRFSVASETGQIWHPRVFGEWNPLTNDADACAVLDKMVELGWNYQIRNAFFERHGHQTICQFWKPEPFASHHHETGRHDRRRAIAIAALKAVGAWKE